MIWCKNCTRQQPAVCTHPGLIWCTGCGKVVNEEIHSSQPIAGATAGQHITLTASMDTLLFEVELMIEIFRVSHDSSREPEKQSRSLDTGRNKRLETMMSKLLGTLSPREAVDRTKLHGPDNKSSKQLDKSDNLSDIDDTEIASYLLNEEEKFLKKIMWEKMNQGYLKQEQAAKKAASAASRKANLAAGVAKSKKGQQRRRSVEAKNAQTAAGSNDQTANKRLSSKINYDLLEEILGETMPSPNLKKSRTESEPENNLTSAASKSGMGDHAGNGRDEEEYYDDFF
ncbi:hypothetical protein Ancab_040054 [Ancistrocladus abbreviatus]